MKKIFIVHGWGGSPEGGWIPWLKKELEDKGFKVEVPTMPNTDEPEIDAWVSHLKEKVGNADKDTYFVGHSIGCQTILRYLELLEENVKIGGALFVAGWINLISKAIEDEGSSEIAKPWLEKPINFNKILTHTKNFIAIFSDNDPYVPQTDSKIFKEKLNAKIIIEHNKDHISKDKLQSTLDSILEISK